MGICLSHIDYAYWNLNPYCKEDFWDNKQLLIVVFVSEMIYFRAPQLMPNNYLLNFCNYV